MLCVQFDVASDFPKCVLWTNTTVSEKKNGSCKDFLGLRLTCSASCSPGASDASYIYEVKYNAQMLGFHVVKTGPKSRKLFARKVPQWDFLYMPAPVCDLLLTKREMIANVPTNHKLFLLHILRTNSCVNLRPELSHFQASTSKRFDAPHAGRARLASLAQ